MLLRTVYSIETCFLPCKYIMFRSLYLSIISVDVVLLFAFLLMLYLMFQVQPVQIIYLMDYGKTLFI